MEKRNWKKESEKTRRQSQGRATTMPDSTWKGNKLKVAPFVGQLKEEMDEHHSEGGGRN